MKHNASVWLVVAGLSLAGCGTINTVYYEDKLASNNPQIKKSYCGALPRIYSGVFYDFCVLHGPAETNAPDDQRAGAWPVLDIIPSLVLDTLHLPYTIFRQSTDGSIELTH